MSVDLASESDRLIAISGLSRFSFGGTDGEYLAGLRKSNWIHNLLWCPTLDLQSQMILATSLDQTYSIDVPMILSLHGRGRPHVPLAYLHSTAIEPLTSGIYGKPKSVTLEISCLLIPVQFKELNTKDGIFKPIEDSYATGHGVYMFTDGFVLPLPYSRSHHNQRALLTIPCVCGDFTPTCFIIPLVESKIADKIRDKWGLESFYEPALSQQAKSQSSSKKE